MSDTVTHKAKAGTLLTGTEYEAADAHDPHDHDAAYEPIGEAASAASSAVATHAGAADPHTGYLKESDFSGVDALVGTATGLLSGEIVVGTSPGGELGGTWASPTVDATHSGSTHGAAVTTHEAAGDPHTGYRLESADHTHATTGLQAGQLAQANTHQSPDTDSAVGSLHHTIGITATTAAAGNHTHTAATLIGARVDLSGAQSIANSGEVIITWDAEDYDTNAFHFTSNANLTGTVAKTNGSAAIVGTGTAFTTELTVNQVISIPGGATEIGVVKTITDNTHLDLWRNLANTSSGQTGQRRNSYMAIPLGRSGYYEIGAALSFGSATNSARYARINAVRSGTEEVVGIGGTSPGATTTSFAQARGRVNLSEGDYVWVAGLQASTTNPLALTTTQGFCWFELMYIAT